MTLVVGILFEDGVGIAADTRGSARNCETSIIEPSSDDIQKVYFIPDRECWWIIDYVIKKKTPLCNIAVDLNEVLQGKQAHELVL